MAKKTSQKTKSARSSTTKRSSNSKKSAAKKTTAPSMNSSVSSPTFDVGKGSFVFGVLLALVVGVIVGVLNLNVTLGVGVTYAVIFILGLVVGLLNITTKEINEFLIASITFLVAANVNIFVISLTLPTFGGIVKQLMLALSIFVAPAATVVALKAIYELAKKK